jgi:hypothetical protein
MFYQMVNNNLRSTMNQALVNTRSGWLPEEEEFGTKKMFKLFKAMVSFEPNLRPEAEVVVKECDVILTDLRNNSNLV